MFGQMMDRPLLISGLIEHAARFHGATEIVSRESDRSLHRASYAETADRARQLANALVRLGVKPGDRIATMAWNTHRHFELYYGISGIGAVMHTINPRLFPDQIAYMATHAADTILFADASFAPLIAKLRPALSTVRQVVLLGPAGIEAALDGAIAYESLLAGETADFDWPEFDERAASSLCYTSGTTGNPKGVLYSHRSTVLHALGVATADMLGMRAADSVCPVVPMFHVNAWGIPYVAPMVGARLVLPGQFLDGESLCSLFHDERVTLSAGVPTLWAGALDHVARTGGDFGAIERIVIGGAAAPPSMIEAFERLGITALHGWGMTETSPLGTVAVPKACHATPEERRHVGLSQGRPPFLVDLRLIDDRGTVLPHDGQSVGDLQIRGAWVASAYFDDEDGTAAAFDGSGWFSTGDVGTIDAEGYLRLTDRSKDVIKSGGEWISSIDLENAATAHPDVAEAAVIGIPHPRWSERPLLLVVAQPGAVIGRTALRDFLSRKVAKWWLPDDILVVTELPHTATGKIMKTKLRQDFAGYVLPTA